jgi:hypothetical protein
MTDYRDTVKGRYFISGKLRERDSFAEGYDYRYFNCVIEMDFGWGDSRYL